MKYYHFYSFHFFLSFQHWADEIMRLAYSLSQLNGSATNFLMKAHTRLCLQVDKAGKITVKK